MHKIVIETPRLILREFTAGDAEFIIELLNSPGWLKYIGTRSVNTPEDALKYINEKLRKSYAESGFGFYLVELKETGEKAGMSGLVKRDTLDDVDIGFALLPQFENKGIAAESSLAVVEFAKNVLKLPKLAAITVPYNTASIKLLEKLGMKFERTINIPGDPEELMLYTKELNN